MALYETSTITSTDNLVSSLETFLSTNGWTINFSGTYNSRNRIHFSKNGYHAEFWASSDSVVNHVGCSGYAAGLDPTAQPDVSTTKSSSALIVGANYYFISSGNSIFLACTYAGPTGPWMIAALVGVVDKCGSWAGGQLATAIYSAAAFTSNMFYSSGLKGQVFYEGAWTTSTTSTVAGSVVGNVSETVLRTKQPCTFNGALVPIPVSLMMVDTVTTYRRPIGVVEGLYMCGGGDIYEVGDVLTISGSFYLLLPNYSATLGGQYDELLFKLYN